ncbi:DUF262 domain-containing protein [Sphingomonas sp. MAH-20]|uniref:DUF262 domain-containing protein n=2 Tax=Sphingomonas horti TaxID=2682842 RepID=A0A6I4J2T9_9SPHN|nr:DUF262 domain-containing protein [Sphingomonas sp. CGMCC 1.13658]MBA2918714.1 DUF262 domain-containing protein [Sphingomonas sp. CGMCC 1.13658]MVO78745.1 DUF262 domain-containing protein [Sphingomonas horti]
MLNEEISTAQRLVKTDAYQMSIGEVVNMYRDKEIIIDPEFQRLFRWDAGQKSRLFESILLGIPLPSIFVFEREDSKWELIDGLQRTSTILEFMGLLRSPEGDLKAPSVLEATRYLPSLYNVVWEKSDQISGVPIDQQMELTSDLKLAVRRSRIAVEILKRPSDNNTKYDLFQRLNAGGTPANAQELRNCIIIMANREFFQGLRALADNADFLAVAGMTDDQIEKQRPMEYISRLLVHLRVPYDGRLDVEEYINEGIISQAEQGLDNVTAEGARETFRILNEAHGVNALRRLENGVPRGKVSLVAFEVIAVGVAANIAAILQRADPVEYVRDRVAALWQAPEIEQFFSAGMRGTTRIQRTVPFGREWFANG